MKKYRKCDEIVEILKAMVRERIRHSSYFLPGEVAMAEEIGVSRITLRKALAVLEQEGAIRRDGVRTEIVEKRDILSNCGKILFTANTRCSTFDLPAMERLWTRFAPEVINRGGNVELFPVNYLTRVEEWQERISKADVIFLTAVPDGPAESWEKALNGKIVFSLLETFSAPNSIYLSNEAVGRAAAHTLIKAGCRKIAGICFDYIFFKNLIFTRRMEGFREALKESYLYHPDLIKLIPYPSNGRFNPSVGDKYSKAAREVLEEVYHQGCDGVFIASDEEIGLIAMNLLHGKIIPERMKLLTVNGVGDAVRNDPPIACLSHGTHKTVEAAIGQLKLIAEKRFNGPVNLMIPPNLYSNSTLNDVFFPDARPEPVSAVAIGHGF